jgi:hypothetical protein
LSQPIAGMSSVLARLICVRRRSRQRQQHKMSDGQLVQSEGSGHKASGQEVPRVERQSWGLPTSLPCVRATPTSCVRVWAKEA